MKAGGRQEARAPGELGSLDTDHCPLEEDSTPLSPAPVPWDDALRSVGDTSAPTSPGGGWRKVNQI